jgi:hypothetical protein
MIELRAYQNCELTKAALVARMQAHYDADEIIKGVTGGGGKGCTVWCALNQYNHAAFPAVLGLPEWLARLIEQIFESLPDDKARQFSQDWPIAIAEGADLALVKSRFFYALLVDPDHGVIRHSPDSTEILAVAALHQRAIDGEVVADDEWRAAAAKAADAADAAAADAAYAPAAAAYAAARAARAAEAAARAAAVWAVYAAAEVAEAAEAAEVWAWQRDLLLELLRSAPVNTPDVDLTGTTRASFP